MNFEELESFKFEKTEVTDSVIISFGTFNGIDEIHAVDIKLFDEIPEEIGRHDGHIVTLEDDTEGQFFTYGNNAEELFKIMKPILDEFDFLKNAEVYLSFTDNNKIVRNLEFKLSAS
ncbi:hypothetical protein [Winogradskyella pacifica]|uniref:hypothetical protein n=1 Tax=Winogradskyella pacifica TaxID=664642 RepID=UPI0015CB3305|nr:hypothetical protein [Winogradskyella pacifica]